MNEKGLNPHELRRSLQMWGGVTARPRAEDTVAFAGASGRPETGVCDAVRTIPDTSRGRKSLGVILSDMGAVEGTRAEG